MDQAVLKREQAEEQVARGVDRTGHDRQLPRLLSLTKKAGKVQHMLQRRVVAARGCNYNEVPARLLGLPFPRRILGPGADGTTGPFRRGGHLPRVVLADADTQLSRGRGRRTEAAARVLRNQPESAHSGV